jgi:hypothetical protein
VFLSHIKNRKKIASIADAPFVNSFRSNPILYHATKGCRFNPYRKKQIGVPLRCTHMGRARSNNRCSASLHVHGARGASVITYARSPYITFCHVLRITLRPAVCI